MLGPLYTQRFLILIYLFLRITSTSPQLLRPKSPLALSSTPILCFLCFLWLTGISTAPEVTHLHWHLVDLRVFLPRQRSHIYTDIYYPTPNPQFLSSDGAASLLWVWGDPQWRLMNKAAPSYNQISHCFTF